MYSFCSYYGSSFANKGMCRSEGSSMFSVGNLVAFSYSHYCSPDGNDGRRGINLLGEEYFLEKEIVLEEYNNTKSDHYGSGHYDVKEIVEIANLWKHRESSWQRFGGYSRYFLCEVLETNESKIEGSFVKSKRIEEIRENPGKWLHVYEVDETDFEIAEKTDFFESAIQKIKRESPKNKAKYGLENWTKGEEIPVWHSHQSYYAPRAGVGGDGTPTGGSWSTDVKAGWLKIMPCVPAGHYPVQIFNYSGYINVPDRNKNQTPNIGLNVHTHWANSQSYKTEALIETNIEKGWFFFNGEDLYQPTVKAVLKNRDEQAQKRREKFEDLSKAVTEKYGEEVLRIVLSKKGSIISILKALNESKVQVKYEDFRKIFSLSDSATVIANLMVCVAGRIDPQKAAKLSQKAFAWSYLGDALPEVSFAGYFDDAVAALKIYSVKWEKNVVEEFIPATNILGDFFKKS